jgi:hypothetical protein
MTKNNLAGDVRVLKQAIEEGGLSVHLTALIDQIVAEIAANVIDEGECPQ